MSRNKLRVSTSYIAETYWSSDKLLSYLLGVLNVEVFKSYGRFGGQDNVNLQEDGVAADMGRQSARRPNALELRLVMGISKL